MPQKSQRAGSTHFLQTRNFLLPAQSLKCVLLPQRKPSGGDSPSVDHLCRATSLSVACALTLIVLAKTSLQIRCDATIKGVVPAKQHIHPPGLAMIRGLHAFTVRGQGMAGKDVQPYYINRRSHGDCAMHSPSSRLADFYIGRPQSLSSSKARTLRSAAWHEWIALVPL
jgi:hypothetical protein